LLDESGGSSWFLKKPRVYDSKLRL
jgi:hypothetical protein